MSLDLSNTDKLAVFYQDARRFDVTVRPPDVNRSGADFEVENGEVLYALGAVRNVGLEAMKHLVAIREEGGPFRDIFDFVERVDPKLVNKRAIENLARAGAFDCFDDEPRPDLRLGRRADRPRPEHGGRPGWRAGRLFGGGSGAGRA